MEKPIIFEKKDGIGVLRLNKPKSYNAFDLEMAQLMAEHLITISADVEVVGVIVTGEGKAFCAGGDLAWVNAYGKDHGAAFHELAARFHQAVLEIRRMPKPVVAAINGPAAGGGFSLALACDFRIMGSSAVLRQAYTSNGLSIDGGGTFMLPRLVGFPKAMEIAAFDRAIRAEEALEMGLVTEVADDGESLNRSIALVEEMKMGSLSSFAASKKLMTDSFNTMLENQLEKERDYLSWCSNEPDGKEGIRAFLEKRKPVFGKKS